MAEKIDNFEWNDDSKSKYGKYLDGSTWKLIFDEDVPSRPGGRSTLYRMANRRGLKLRTSVLDDGTGIVVQAYRPEAGS